MEKESNKEEISNNEIKSFSEYYTFYSNEEGNLTIKEKRDMKYEALVKWVRNNPEKVILITKDDLLIANAEILSANKRLDETEKKIGCIKEELCNAIEYVEEIRERQALWYKVVSPKLKALLDKFNGYDLEKHIKKLIKKI